MSTNQNSKFRSNYFMKLALLQAKKVLGNTKKNPAVGCVIVKNQCVISTGATGSSGVPHAEYKAIKSTKSNLNNSNLYVTLEPCSHYGKTHPCTDIIKKNKIRKVFFSILDPDIRSHNKSTKILNKKKILVKKGILKSKIKEFYKSYLIQKSSQLPFVTSKIAISRDFFSNNIKKKWITNQLSRGRVHLMRSKNDCILTSINTVIADNPILNCRIKGLEKRSPTRVIIDKNLSIPLNSKIIRTSLKNKTLIFYNTSKNSKIKNLKKYKIQLVKSSLNKNSKLDLKKILFKLKSLGHNRIFLESGAELTSTFLREMLVNKINIFMSDKKINKNGNKSFKEEINYLYKNFKPTNVRVNLCGDKLVTFNIK